MNMFLSTRILLNDIFDVLFLYIAFKSPGICISILKAIRHPLCNNSLDIVELSGSRKDKNQWEAPAGCS